jgi:hypothetical protein
VKLPLENILFVVVPTIVAYSYAEIWKVDRAEMGLRSNSLVLDQPVNADLLKRIQQGAIISRRTPNEIKPLVQAELDA